MEPSVTKTVRIPGDIIQRMENFGLPHNDIIVQALREFFNMPPEPSVEFMKKVCKWVEDTFEGKPFEEDVTLKVFRHIQSDKTLFAAYKKLTGTQEAKEVLHRRLGKMVKQALKAEVVGRSLPLDPEKELIKTYALLRPPSK